MPKFEVVFKVQKMYRTIIEAENEEEAEERAILFDVSSEEAFHLMPDDVWVSSISQIEEGE